MLHHRSQHTMVVDMLGQKRGHDRAFRTGHNHAHMRCATVSPTSPAIPRALPPSLLPPSAADIAAVLMLTLRAERRRRCCLPRSSATRSPSSPTFAKSSRPTAAGTTASGGSSRAASARCLTRPDDDARRGRRATNRATAGGVVVVGGGHMVTEVSQATVLRKGRTTMSADGAKDGAQLDRHRGRSQLPPISGYPRDS